MSTSVMSNTFEIRFNGIFTTPSNSDELFKMMEDRDNNTWIVKTTYFKPKKKKKNKKKKN